MIDSLSTETKIDISVVLQIAKVFPVTKSILQLDRLAVQQQIGIHDCGVFYSRLKYVLEMM